MFNRSILSVKMIKIFLVCLLGIVLTTCIQSDKTSPDWSEWSACSDTCGGCGTRNRTRICQSEGCRGNEKESESCNMQVCLFPRTSCCPGLYKAASPDKTGLICLKPKNSSGIGIWSEWSGFSNCSLDCGGCGVTTRTRTCNGGSCNGANKESQPCGGMLVCLFPNPSCCSPYKKMIINKEFACGIASQTTLQANK